MKTDDLINMLATGVQAVDHEAVVRRFVAAPLWGVVVSLFGMYVFLGVRPDIASAVLLPMFWVKLLFPLLIAAASLVGAFRLACPGRRLGAAPYAVMLPVVLIWLLALVALANAAAGQRLPLIWGNTWLVCPVLIALLALPVFVAVFRVMREMASTRPVLGGATAGLLAGAAGAVVYCLHCPEMSAPFLAVWYLAGMLIPAAVGAMVGRKLLRW